MDKKFMEVYDMIKGVTKNIIEVNNPESIYFEKAVFYLRPDIKELPPDVSRREIERYISKFGENYGRKKHSESFLKWLACFLLFADIGLVFLLFMS